MNRLIISALFLALSTSAFAQVSATYACKPSKDSQDTETYYTLTVSGDSVTLKENDGAKEYKLTQDESYKPRYNQGYLKFNSSELERDQPEAYSLDLLITESVLAGATKGSMKRLARGEGFFNDYYNCVRE